MIGSISRLRRSSRISFCLALSALLACIEPSAAETGAGVELANQTEENHVVIRGVVQTGQPIPNFGGNLLLKGTGSNRVDLRLRSTPLELDADPRVVINRGDVSIPAGTAIEPGQASDVRINVANVSRAGLYHGKLRFWALGADESKALEVPVTLEVGVRPALALLGSAPQWNLVRCEWTWVCWLADQILYTSATENAQSFRLENRSALPADRINVLTLLRGTNNKSNDAAHDVEVVVPTSILGSDSADIKVTVDRNRLDADSYEGSVRLRTPGSDEPLTVPLVVNVRIGPVVPLILIIAGIVAGRLSRQLESPEIKAQMKALQRFYIASSRIDHLRDADSVRFLRDEATEIKRKIERGSTSEQDMTAILAKFEGHIDFLAQLDTLDINLAATPALQAAVAGDLAAARSALSAGDDDAARKSYDAARQKIKAEAAKPAPMVAKGPTSTVAPSVLLSIDKPVLAQSETATQLGFWAKTWAFLTGDPSVGASLRYWLVQPLLALTLLIALAAIGLYTLYVKVPTFGSSGLYEYLGLFVWGLGAEVAQRTLTGLQLSTR
jgi:hypothetical protein